MVFRILNLFVLVLNSAHMQISFATASSFPAHGLQGQCKGLNPAYDKSGNLIGYKGVCDVDKWNSSLLSTNSLHPIDPDLMSLHNGNSPTGKIKYEQPKDQSLFDWLSPHHDIIRNHPHYRQAHLNHAHCIRKKKTGLFDFLGSLFSFDSPHKNNAQFDDLHDPYSVLDKETRCLSPQYYSNSPLDTEKKYYDSYALQLGHQIHHIQNQFDNSGPEKIELLKKALKKCYTQLHRHLDCHCHHESPQSKMLNIHHHPMEGHSMDVIAQPISDSEMNSHLQFHSSIPFDSSMDMEDDRMALMRMSNSALQHAYNMNYLNNESLNNNNALRMEMFHPVNPYVNESDNYMQSNSEWNRLKVEKVIVIKRIKVPVVTKVSVPVPVPVPYPIPASSNSIASNDNNQYLNYGNSNYFSQFNDSQPHYLGNNTYMINSPETQSEQMNSIVRAISGAPCESAEQVYNRYDYYPMSDQFTNQRYNYNTVPEYGGFNHCNIRNMPNPVMSAHTVLQPGLQLYPSPYAQSQFINRYTPLQNLNQQFNPTNLQPYLHNSQNIVNQSQSQLIPPATAVPQNLQPPVLNNQNLQPPVLLNQNLKY